MITTKAFKVAYAATIDFLLMTSVVVISTIVLKFDPEFGSEV